METVAVMARDDITWRRRARAPTEAGFPDPEDGGPLDSDRHPRVWTA